MSRLEVLVNADRPARRGRLMRTREVAELFDVDPKTVLNWRRGGKVTGLRTPGGHEYRFWEDEVDALLADSDIAELT